MDSSERWMNPVAMTIIDPQKWIGQAEDRTSNLLFSSRVHYQMSYGAPDHPLTVRSTYHINKTWYRLHRLTLILPDDKILDKSKLKQIANGILKCI